MAEAEQIAHLANRRQGARLTFFSRVRGARRRVRESGALTLITQCDERQVGKGCKKFAMRVVRGESQTPLGQFIAADKNTRGFGVPWAIWPSTGLRVQCFFFFEKSSTRPRVQVHAWLKETMCQRCEAKRVACNSTSLTRRKPPGDRCGPPFSQEDCVASCQVLYPGINALEWRERHA